ncbi:MAG: glycoside hydrolase family 25 protein [Bacteroides sp.]|nr:glycoside hydrolase family 25 protein [Bacteroidaceae bacterium]MBQ8874437.1 glycoside hydrolase family 25 protein [Bacteroides sp.]
MVKEKKATVKKPTKKPASKRAPSKRKAKKVIQKEIPAWVRYLLYVLVIVVFVSGFYFFFIRPYAYRWKPCYGLKGYGICMPAGYRVHGIDVSHYQGDIDWKMLGQTRQGQFPIQFIFMKATEGGDYTDDRFAANFDSARVHGFVRGAYHFYNPKTDANKQADFFIQSVKLEPGDLPPVLDIEKKGKDMKKLQADLKVWLRKVENHYGVKPIIYASYKFKTRYLNDSVFNTYPYWIAHYYVDSVRYEGDWRFWQHTDVGTLPGIDEKVDLNVFNGSKNELDAFCIP